jgi:uroporphyrinogen-III synthase
MKNALILRPQADADGLQLLLQQRAEQLGVRLSCDTYSMVQISSYDDPSVSIAEVLEQQWHGALMVSVNAAEHFAAQAAQWAPNQAMPKCRWFAVGPSSAAAIAKVVKRPVTCPWRQHNSDALLALAELQQVAGQRWLLIRANEGRELFADTLRARGAEVHYLAVYKRTPVALSAQQIAHWQQHVSCIFVSSAEQLGYFLAAMPRQALSWLQQCEWVVASRRLADLLPAAIAPKAVIAESATPFAMVEAWQQVITHQQETSPHD